MGKGRRGEYRLRRRLLSEWKVSAVLQKSRTGTLSSHPAWPVFAASTLIRYFVWWICLAGCVDKSEHHYQSGVSEWPNHFRVGAHERASMRVGFLWKHTQGLTSSPGVCFIGTWLPVNQTATQSYLLNSKVGLCSLAWIFIFQLFRKGEKEKVNRISGSYGAWSTGFRFANSIFEFCSKLLKGNRWGYYSNVNHMKSDFEGIVSDLSRLETSVSRQGPM